MILKHKKILIGGVIAAVTIGTLTGILVPILNKESQSDDKKSLLSYESLVAKIIAAKDEQEAKDQTMKLYGLELKNDDAILSLGDGKKNQYLAASTLGKYIFDHKDKYQIRVYEGSDSNDLKQLLLVFKLKAIVEKSASDSANWPTNKIDTNQDEFAFLHTIFKDKFVHGKFENGKLDSAPENFVSNFKTQEYEMLKLYFAFKIATPNQEDFSTYNMANDTNAFAITTIKDYIISLVSETALLSSDLENNILFTPNPGSASEGLAQGTITFKYDDLENIIKVVKFTYIQGYNIAIADGSEAKVADEVELDDVAFSDTQPPNIAIGGVEVSTKVNDGTRVKVTFTGSNGVTPLVVSQELGGFTSYQDKAWKIVDGMDRGDFNIATADALASGYDKSGILSLIHAKIDEILDDTFQAKVRNAVVISNITLTPNNIIGSLLISINLGSNLKEFTISGFSSTQANEDLKSVAKVKTAIEEIGVMVKITNADIIPVSFQTLNANVFRTLTGLALPDDDGTTLTYTHEGISTDGNLDVLVVISKGTASDSTTFTVAISGITQAKINSFITHPTLKLGASTRTAKNVTTNDLEAPTALDLIITITRVTESTITTDGSVVTVTITVSSTIADTTARTYDVELPGFMTEAAKKIANDASDVNAIKVIINSIVGMTKTVSASISPTSIPQPLNDVKVWRALGLGVAFPNTRSTTLTYTHGGIDSDGDLTINVTISKGEATDIASFMIKVSGINVSAAERAQILKDREDVTFVKNEIDKIIGMTKITVTNIQPTSETSTFNLTAFNSLGSGGTFPDEIRNTILTYSHKGINKDGNLSIAITISKGKARDTATFIIVVSGINQAKINNFNSSPTLKSGVNAKTAKDVILSDLIAPSNLDGDLTVAIIKVIKSIKTTDGSVATVTIRVSSSVADTTARTYDVELLGFMTEVALFIQTKIDNFNAHPILKPGVSKTAKNVTANDLEAPTARDLIITIVKVIPSYLTPNGSTVNVTLKISSNVEGTIPSFVNMELSGFREEPTGLSNSLASFDFATNKPTLKSGVNTKTAVEVTKKDLVLPYVRGLKFEIFQVTKSVLTPDGSTVKVFLKVSSVVKGSRPTRYQWKRLKSYYKQYNRRAHVEVSGFTLEAAASKQSSEVQAFKDVSKVLKWFYTKLGASPWPFKRDVPGTIGYYESDLGNKDEIWPTNIRTFSPTTLGFPLPSFPSDVAISYEPIMRSNKQGTTIIKATISRRGAVSKVIGFRIGGFKKEDGIVSPRPYFIWNPW